MPRAHPVDEPPRATGGIAVVRALRGLGDMLCVVPALRALRAAHPGTPVLLVALPTAAWLAERFPQYVDELVPFPGWPGIPEGWNGPRGLPAFLAAMQARRLDLALQCQGAGLVSNSFTVLLGARVTAGYHHAGQYCPDPGTSPVWDGYEAEPARWVRLLEHLGVPSAGLDLELPVTAADGAELDAAWPGPAPDRWAVLCPGAVHAARRWAPARYAEVADALVERGLTPVLTGLPSDRRLSAAVARRTRHRVVDLTGRLSLGGFAAAVQGAAVVVTNDTGTSHVAAATRTPSVVVFRCSDPQRWAPLDRRRHAVLGLDEPVVAEQLARPGDGRCLSEGCARLGHEAEEVPPASVPTADVLRAVEQVLCAQSRADLSR